MLTLDSNWPFEPAKDRVRKSLIIPNMSCYLGFEVVRAEAEIRTSFLFYLYNCPITKRGQMYCV